MKPKRPPSARGMAQRLMEAHCLWNDRKDDGSYRYKHGHMIATALGGCTCSPWVRDVITAAIREERRRVRGSR